MTQLKKKEVELLDSTLETRFNAAKKFKLGDLELGSIVIVRWVEELPGVDEVAFAILVTFSKNKKDTCLAAFDGFDCRDVRYRFSNNEEVVHLINWI